MTTDLVGRRILVVEDEYILAQCLSEVLESLGAVVLGPVGSVDDAMALLQGGEAPEVAVLDVNLGGTDVYPVADRLMAQGVPFLFTSGYDCAVTPPRYGAVPHCTKPWDARQVTSSLATLVAGRAQ